jgi:hypothetical protein
MSPNLSVKHNFKNFNEFQKIAFTNSLDIRYLFKEKFQLFFDCQMNYFEIIILND